MDENNSLLISNILIHKHSFWKCPIRFSNCMFFHFQGPLWQNSWIPDSGSMRSIDKFSYSKGQFYINEWRYFFRKLLLTSVPQNRHGFTAFESDDQPPFSKSGQSASDSTRTWMGNSVSEHSAWQLSGNCFAIWKSLPRPRAPFLRCASATLICEAKRKEATTNKTFRCCIVTDQIPNEEISYVILREIFIFIQK